MADSKKSSRKNHSSITRLAALTDALPRPIALQEWKLPTFPAIEAASRWAEAFKPLQEVSEQISRQMEAISAQLAPLGERLRWVGEETAKCERLEAVGWLPHSSSPFDLVEENTVDSAGLDSAIEHYYQDNWADISSAMLTEISQCEIDEEAKATFAEAVAAHGYGLYRCVPRLLFPEIERVARIEIHGGAMDKMASQDRLRDAIGGLTPAEMASTGITGLRLYYKLAGHLYAHVKNPAELAKMASDPVPNRHASLHGYVSYRSIKSSLNALVVADYLLQAISTLKRLAAEGRLDAC